MGMMLRMKGARVFLIDEACMQWQAGMKLPLSAEQDHYLRRVLRLRNDETVQVSDGQGHRWQAIFLPGSGASAVMLGSRCSSTVEPDWTCDLIQALSTGDKMDWTIEKAVELGVHAVSPLQAERSVSRIAPSNASRKQQHWQAVAMAAALQCGRDVLPQVMAVKALEDVFAVYAATPHRWVLCPGEGPSLRAITKNIGDRPRIAIAIGPESGWSPEELRRFVTAGWQPLGLGPRVLRTETAGLAVLASLEALLGSG
jgi:16S rRNA (uracil1498-N3)-methyltransferase